MGRVTGRALGLWLLARPVRTLVTIGGVALGVASVLSTLLASRAAVAFLASDVERIAGRARLEVTRPGGVDVAWLGSLRDLSGEVEIAPVIDQTAFVPALGDLVRVLGVDLLMDVRELALDAGDGDGAGGRPPNVLLTARAAALPRALAERLELAVGDSIEIVVRSRHEVLEVGAIFEPARFASAFDRVLLVDVALAQELFARTGARGRHAGLDRIELAAHSEPGGAEPDLEALAARVAERLPPDARVAPPSARRRDGERMIGALRFNLTALSGVSLLVGAVLVATTLATSVVQRRRAIALLRSLGASRAQLSLAILAEAAVVGTAGGALGVALGWAGAHRALASVRATVTTLVQGPMGTTISLEPRWAALGLALGLGGSLLAAGLALGEALRTPPIQGLGGELDPPPRGRAWRARLALFALSLVAAAVCVRQPPIGDRPVFALAAALFLLAAGLVMAAPLVDLAAALGGRRLERLPSLRVAQAALAASRRRAAWAAGAVGVAFALAVAMTTMIGSFRRTIVEWTTAAVRSDLFVRPLPAAGGVSSGGVDPEVVRVARERFGDAAVDAFHSASARFQGETIELSGGGRSSRVVLEESGARGGAAVNEAFTRRFGSEVGDLIAVETPGGEIEREITGLFRDYSGPLGRVVIDRADFVALYPHEGPQSLAVDLAPGADVASAREALRAALGGRFEVEVLANRELRTDVLAVFERTFAVTAALELVASAVAAIAVALVLAALVDERRRELATLRVLGASRAQLAGVVVGEAALLGLTGILGGLASGLAVGWVLVAVVNVQSFGWTLDFAPPFGSIGRTACAVLPACLLAALPPAVLALRAPLREALHETT